MINLNGGKKYFLRLDAKGNPINGTLIFRRIAPRTNGRWIDITDCLTPCDVPLDTPTSFTAGSITTTTMALNWSDVTGATSYTVYKATNGSFTNATIAYTGTTSAANITGLTPNTAYFFKVQATADGVLCVSDSEFAFLTASTLATTTTTTSTTTTL